MTNFVPSKASFAAYTKMTQGVLHNMAAKGQFKQFAGLLLAGDPGVGKTTYINFLSKLLGIEVITIEAPFITEEHIINIPFIVFNPSTGSQKTGSTKVESNEYKVVLADSNLFSQISAARQQPDDEYLKKIYSGSKDVIAVFESFGGTADTIPEEFHAARSKYSVILFLDEYFRQTSDRIRNILRGILNGKIGRHDIPAHSYIIYASNIHDQGVENIPKNNQFDVVTMKHPNKEQWFSWLVYKFENDKHVKLKKEVINEFYTILNDEDLSHDDPAAEVRTSPRRWEQLLLYINEGLPVKDEKEAKNLLTNVKTNFRNYLEGSHSDLAEKAIDAVVKLIKKTSNIEVSAGTLNGSHEWRDTLKHQIEMKMKLGEHRKYVPIISGLPGIGKTAQADAVAKDLDLRFIDIDVSQLNAEDVIGLPIPDQKGDNIKTSFSTPGLYQMIMQKIKEEDESHIEKLKAEGGEDKVKEYKKRPWKYLIFFDELNRNDTKVFNSIRRILLEKNFGPAGDGGKLLTLPKEAIMMGAINPHDLATKELTSHVRDVLDIIHSSSSWKDTLGYLGRQKVHGLDESTHDLFLNILKKFVEKFKSRDKNIELAERPFHLDMGADVYISPREYTQLFINGSLNLHSELKKIHALDLHNMKPDKLAELETQIREAIFESFEKTLEMPFIKHDVDSLEFMNDLKHWILHSPDIDIGENVFYKKGKGINLSVKDVIGEHLDGAAKTSAAENQHFINFLNNTDLSQFREGLTELLEEKITDQKSADKYILKETYPRKILKGGKIVDDTKAKASLLHNFMLELIFALHLNEMSNDKIQAIYSGVNKGVREYLKKNKDVIDSDLASEITSTVVPMMSDINDEIDNLPA